MATLSVRRESNGGSLVPEITRTFDPFHPIQTMRDLLRWEPFSELSRGMPYEQRSFSPNFDVIETNDSLIFKADVPGVVEKDLDVTLSGNRLMIAGKRESEHEERSDTYYKSERTWGAFSRSFALPDNVDPAHITAELKAGVLRVEVPKSGPTEMKKIPIRSTEKEKQPQQKS